MNKKARLLVLTSVTVLGGYLAILLLIDRPVALGDINRKPAPDLADTVTAAGGSTLQANPETLVRSSVASPEPKRIISGMEALELAKETSPLGRLEDSELQSLVALLVVAERNSQERLYGYLASGGRAGSAEHANHDFGVTGSMAKAEALLAGSYLLLPNAVNVPAEITRDPQIHVVEGSGGLRGDTEFRTVIVINLKHFGLFAEAKKNLERALKDRR